MIPFRNRFGPQLNRQLQGLVKTRKVGNGIRTASNVAGTPKKGIFRRVWQFAKITAGLTTLAGIGALGLYVYDEREPDKQDKQTPFFENGQKKKTLVILGSGWGTIPFLKNLDTRLYNVVIVSPRNYFLFTPLLPSCPTGTISTRSVIEPVRMITRKLPAEVIYLEAEATDIDPVNNKVTIKQSATVNSGHSKKDTSSSKSTVSEYVGIDEITTSLNYDYLLFGVGAQPSTFGIPGVSEHSVFLKEISDAVAIRRRLMDSIEAANILPLDDPNRKRLLSIVVVGGGPTGVEAAAELQDYIDQDLKKWMPQIASELKVSLLEALPTILGSFEPKLIDYTKSVFNETNINLQLNCMVKKVDDINVYAQKTNEDGSKSISQMPYGMIIWATGNAPRAITQNLISKIDEQKNARRGILVNEHLLADGTDNIYAIGDCAFTKNPPLAQVAFQQGLFLAKHFERLHEIDSLQYRISHPSPNENPKVLHKKLELLTNNIPKFQYNHQGSLAYIGSEKAVADIVWHGWSRVSAGGTLTFLFWRSAYIYMCLSVRNQLSICLDWINLSLFGRDCSKE